MGHSSGRLLDTPTVTRIKADVRGSFAELAIFAASGLLGLVRARTPGAVWTDCYKVAGCFLFLDPQQPLQKIPK